MWAICRVGQDHTFIGITVYVRYFWQGNHHTYGHIRCVYTVLANPSHMGSAVLFRVWAVCFLALPTHVHPCLHVDVCVHECGCECACL